MLKLFQEKDFVEQNGFIQSLSSFVSLKNLQLSTEKEKITKSRNLFIKNQFRASQRGNLKIKTKSIDMIFINEIFCLRKFTSIQSLVNLQKSLREIETKLRTIVIHSKNKISRLLHQEYYPTPFKLLENENFAKLVELQHSLIAEFQKHDQILNTLIVKCSTSVNIVLKILCEVVILCIDLILNFPPILFTSDLFPKSNISFTQSNPYLCPSRIFKFKHIPKFVSK